VHVGGVARELGDRLCLVVESHDELDEGAIGHHEVPQVLGLVVLIAPVVLVELGGCDRKQVLLMHVNVIAVGGC
jgi:hypothetical protein